MALDRCFIIDCQSATGSPTVSIKICIENAQEDVISDIDVRSSVGDCSGGICVAVWSFEP